MSFRQFIGCVLLIAGLVAVTVTVAGLLMSLQLNSGRELMIALAVLGGGLLAILLGTAALVLRR